MQSQGPKPRVISLDDTPHIGKPFDAPKLELPIRYTAGDDVQVYDPVPGVKDYMTSEQTDAALKELLEGINDFEGVNQEEGMPTELTVKLLPHQVQLRSDCFYAR